MRKLLVDMELEKRKIRHEFNGRLRCFKKTCQNQRSIYKDTIFNEIIKNKPTVEIDALFFN